MSSASDQSRARALAAAASIAIITALPKEMEAVRAMLDGPVDFSSEGRAPGEYCIGELPAKGGGAHAVVVACSWMGENLAAANVTVVLERLPTIRAVLMVGIAGAAPNPEKLEHDIHLGDIVVSSSAGVVQYDLDKELSKNGAVERTPRHPPRPPGARLLAADTGLQGAELRGERPWEAFFARAKKLKWTRRPTAPDVLHRTDTPSVAVERLANPDRRKRKPLVFRGPIASGNKLLKNAHLRDRLVSAFGVMAVEMEAAGVADASWLQNVEYLVVRGTCDYCDEHKSDPWQGYAAMIAAAYARALLERLPSTGTVPSPPQNVEKESAAAAPRLPSSHTRESPNHGADALTSRSQPPTGAAGDDPMAAALAALASRYDLRASVTALGPAPDLAPPLRVAARASRPGTVAQLLKTLSSHLWVAINGTSGSGKTELALLLAEHAAQHCTWLSLRELDEPEAMVSLRSAVAALAPGAIAADGPDAGDRLAAVLGSGHLVVLDDLPTFDADGPLGRTLVLLAEAFGRGGVSLLTTSAHVLPSRVEARLGSRLHAIAVPDFSDDEAVDLFRAHGASAEWCDLSRVRFINAIAAGHPELLVTAAIFLKLREWRFSDSELEPLLRRGYTASIESDVMRRLEATVPSKAARELLFRASLVSGAFSLEDVVDLAAIEPEIGAPRAALAALEGLWLQRARSGTYAVCPLVKNFSSEVPRATRRRVERMLGERIVGRSQLGPVDVLAAIAHFIAAEEAERAAAVYCHALSSLKDAVAPVYDGGLAELWATQPLPATMTRGSRLVVRALQIAARERLGRPVDYIADDALALAEKASEEESWALLPLVPHIGVLSVRDFGRTTAVVLRLVQAGRVVLPDGNTFVWPKRMRAATFFWHQTAFARGFDDIRVWLASLANVPTEHLDRAVQDESCEMCCMTLCDRLVMTEAGKPVGERSWSVVLERLDEIAVQGRKVGLELLWACARRARIAVLGDYQSHLEEAARLAEQTLAEASDDPRIRFMIRECLGREYARAKLPREAQAHLEAALSESIAAYAVVRLYALRVASEVIGDTSPDRAADLAAQALRLARTISGLPASEVAKLLGELAIAEWLAHGVGAAFDALAEALALLLSRPADDREWQDLFVLLAHTTQHLASVATTGAPPRELAADDGTASSLPRGVFFTEHPTRYTLYQSRHEAKVCTVMACLADALDRDDPAIVWAHRGIEAAERFEDPSAAEMAETIIGTDLVVNDSPVEALDRASTRRAPDSAMAYTFVGIVARLAWISLDDTKRARESAAKVGAALRRC